MASAALSGFCCFPVRLPTATSRVSLPSLSSIRDPSRRSPRSFSSKCKGYYLLTSPVRLQRTSIAAVVGDATAVPNGCTEKQMPSLDASDPSCNSGELTKSNDKDGQGDIEALDSDRMTRVCDKLIGVFLVDKPSTTDWRRLLAFSKNWDSIRSQFYKRCQDRAESEDDPGMKQKLLRLRRKLKEIDDDVQRHNKLLQVIKVPASEVSDIVARRRKDFTKEFFTHLFTVAASYHDNPTEQKALVNLGNLCLASVKAYDIMAESVESLSAADLNFKDMLNSPSAFQNIDSIAEKNVLNSALGLIGTKAWSDGKETRITKEEVMEGMYANYLKAIDDAQRLVPKEVRILKYLLTIQSTEQLLCTLKDVFTPGPESGGEVDILYTTPKDLIRWMKVVVDAFKLSRERTLIKQARVLLHPVYIQRIEELMQLIQNKFM